MKLAVACLLSVLAVASAQNAGTLTQESPLAISYQECTAPGSCTTRQGSITLDSNWRWTHAVSGSNNCYTGNNWDMALCPDPDTCAQNCAIDGVASGDWAGTYGINSINNGNGISIQFETVGPYSTNVGARVYLLDSSSNYVKFHLLNREFSFVADDSQLECGLNGAVYFVEMEANGGMGGSNRAGARLGTGYCDAQCPHDMKWIDGVANVVDWTPHPEDPNSGKGNAGICCPEMDLWEANKHSTAYTSHPCAVTGYYPCEGTECGDNASDERYDGVCDKDGCDFASYRLGDQTYWGPGSGFTIDSEQPVQIVTQFITDNGQDDGELVEIRRVYVQGGTVIQNSRVNIAGVSGDYDSITTDFCEEVKDVFGDIDDHGIKGGLAEMGRAFASDRGMVFVMSLWADFDAHMLWLDSTYPTTGGPDQPGTVRGPCATTTGHPLDVQAQYPRATVRFSDIKFGPIDSTY